MLFGFVEYKIDGISYSTELIAENDVTPSNGLIILAIVVLLLFITYIVLFGKSKKKNK